MSRSGTSTDTEINSMICCTLVRSLDAGLSKRLRSRRQSQPVRSTRSVGKKDMRFNDAMPPVHVHPLTHEVTINGERIGMEPLARVPLSRLYIVS
jgi:urease subunit alpha